MMEQIPKSEVIQRVHAISHDQKNCGSALAFPVAGQFCFITAAHVLDGMKEGVEDTLFIYGEKGWTPIRGTPFFANSGVDVAIVKVAIPSDESFVRPILSNSAGMVYGQDAFFLGFPYFGRIDYKPQVSNSGYPIPFVKKATVAAFDGDTIYLDGHNNPGFSGGPVLFYHYEERRIKVCGIISAYITHVGEVKKIKTSQINVKDFYLENSGIAVAYNAKFAIDLMRKVYGQSFNG
jgi:hypothetical protein